MKGSGIAIVGTALMAAVLWPDSAGAEKSAKDAARAPDCENAQPVAASPSQPRVAQVDAAKARPIYQPPHRGAPRAKVSGAMRGAPDLPTPLALAPDHVAFTGLAQPSLFWHIDGVPGRRSRLVLTLIGEDSIDPLVERELERPKRAGIQRVRLGDLGVRLEPGVEYEWSVTLVVDPAQRSSDVISGGAIRRAAPGEPCPEAWYDSLEALIDAVERSPSDAELRGRQLALLEQAGLDPAVASITH
jgi:hypothetical protein